MVSLTLKYKLLGFPTQCATDDLDRQHHRSRRLVDLNQSRVAQFPNVRAGIERDSLRSQEDLVASNLESRYIFVATSTVP